VSDELKILAVPPDARITAEGKKKLAEMGVCVITSATPEAVRLLRPVTDVDVLPANEFIWAAVQALADGGTYSGEEAMRQRFVKNCAKKLAAKVGEGPAPKL
jgi:hypothetical protein